MNNLKTKIHGFANIYVSDSLAMRHPYISQQRKASDDESAYNSASFIVISRLHYILSSKDSDPLQVQEALLVLNNYSSTQDTKLEMISKDIVEVVVQQLKSEENAVLCEALSLLGSLCSVKAGRDRLARIDTSHITLLITHAPISIGHYLGWMLLRIASGRDGCHLLLSRDIVKALYRRFFSVCYEIITSEEIVIFLHFCLAIFNEVLIVETAIKSFRFGDSISAFKRLLKTNAKNKSLFSGSFQALMLENLAKICVFEKEKCDAITQGLTEDVGDILLETTDELVLYNCIRTFVCLSINLKGKSDIITYKNGILIVKFAEKQANTSVAIKAAIRELIISLSENVTASVMITKAFKSFPEELVSIFGAPVIKPWIEVLKEICAPEVIQDERTVNEVKKCFDILFVFLNNQKSKEELCLVVYQHITGFFELIVKYFLIKDDENFRANLSEIFIILVQYREKNLQLFTEAIKTHNKLKSHYFGTILSEEIKGCLKLSKFINSRLDD